MHIASFQEHLKSFLSKKGHGVSNSAWRLQLYQKRDSGTCVFLWICEISKNTFFTENLRATASELNQL